MIHKKMLVNVLALLVSTGANAAPSKEDMSWVASIIDNNAADDLANLKVCDKFDLHSDYLRALFEVAAVYPNVDPTKFSALVRQIQRKADVLAEIRTSSYQQMPEKKQKLVSLTLGKP